MRRDESKRSIWPVTEIYVAVFPVRMDQSKTVETILAGYRKDPGHPNISQVRATVETQADAVSDLVELCDEIIATQQELHSYRLLKFDKDGIHILSPDGYRTSPGPTDRAQACRPLGRC